MAGWLGIDVGTSAVKAILLGEEGGPLAEAEVALPLSRPRPGWSEQDPEDWWRGVVSALAELRRRQPKAWAEVRAIGLSGQMHAAVVLDAGGAVLRPAILWNDGRSTAECASLNAELPGLGETAGVPAMPGFTAPKLLWLRRHEPQVFARTALVLGAKDLLRLHLTGESATDPSEAAGTLWLDQARRTWSPAILAACGLSLEQMPRLVEGSAVSGRLRPEAAAELGLPSGIAVAAGAGDVAAGAVGIGAIDEGAAFVSLGTSAQYFVTTAAYRPCPQALIHAFAHCLPGRWFQMAALLNGASALGWVAGLLGRDLERLLREVEARYHGPGGLLFLPYLAGERTPHDDPHARGVFFGLHGGSSPEDLALAVLEGVAFSLAEAQDCLAAAGTRVERLMVIGGGARSRFWMRLLASILDRPLLLHGEAARGPALGAARLGRLAVTGEEPAAVCVAPAVEREILPDPGLVEAYARRGERFRRLYRVLREEFREAARD